MFFAFSHKDGTKCRRLEGDGSYFSFYHELCLKGRTANPNISNKLYVPVAVPVVVPVSVPVPVPVPGAMTQSYINRLTFQLPNIFLTWAVKDGSKGRRG